MRSPVIAGPVGTAAIMMTILVTALHLPVLTEGALITPAGMHHAMWPWRAAIPITLGGGARVQENHTLSDLMFQEYPWQVHMTRSLAAGKPPLWNPYSYTGVPFVANAQSAVFYPLHWPAWLIPSMRVFTAAQLMKILLAGIFMAVFLRGMGMSRAPAAIGAASFALCGYMTSWLGYPLTNAALWLPLLMHAARELALRPRVWPFLLMAAATGAQFLGGHPETSLHVVSAAAAWFAWCLWREAGERASGGSWQSGDIVTPPRRAGAAIAFFAGGAALGTAAAAVQLLPFIAYLLRSAELVHRQALSAGMDPSLPAGAILTLLVPDRYGMPWNFTWTAPEPFQAVVGYAGAGVLLLALVSLKVWRRTLFFHVMAALSAVIVFGPPFGRMALRWIPLVGIASNNRLLLLLAFGLAVLAAFGLQQCIDVADRAVATPGRESSRTRRRLLMWLAGCAALLAIAASLTAVWPASSGHGAWRGSAGTASALVAGTALLAALTMMRPSRRGAYLAGIVLLTGLDLFLFAYRFNPHADPGRLFPATPLTDFLRRDAVSDMVRGGRLMTIGWTMLPETQMVYRLSSIEGYDAMEFAPYRRLLDRAGVAKAHATGDVSASSRPLLDLVSLRYIVTPPGGVVSGDDMTLAYDGADGRVFINQRAMPRLSWVPRSRRIRSGDEAIEALASGRADPRREVLIEAAAGATDEQEDPGSTGDTGSPQDSATALTFDRVTEGDLVISVRGAPSSGWLVVSDAWDAGWQATVNGAPEPVLRANGCFRALSIPKGDSVVSLVYRPLAFRMGVWISAGALMMMLGIVLVLLGTPAR